METLPVIRAQWVNDIDLGNYDRLGNRIARLYVIVGHRYAIYRANSRVMIHFADDPAEEAKQEQLLAPLNIPRWEINALIDGWRAQEEAPRPEWWQIWRWPAYRRGKRAACYDERVAEALIAALRGDATGAVKQLDAAKNDIVKERQSIARIDYLMMALGVTAAFVLLMGVISAEGVWKLRWLGSFFDPVWTAVSGGAMGAFFSIATGLQKRTVLIDLQNRDNRADASLRVLIGAISGGVLLSLLISGLAGGALVDTGKLGGDAPQEVLLVYVLGFLAGFAERLLPDLLADAQLKLTEKAPADQPPPKERPEDPDADGKGGAGGEQGGKQGGAPDPEILESSRTPDNPETGQ